MENLAQTLQRCNDLPPWTVVLMDIRPVIVSDLSFYGERSYRQTKQPSSLPNRVFLYRVLKVP